MEMTGTNSIPFCFRASAMFQSTPLFNTDWILFHGKKASTFCLDFNTFKNCLESSVERL